MASNRLAGGAAGTGGTTWLPAAPGTDLADPPAGEFARGLFPELAGSPRSSAACRRRGALPGFGVAQGGRSWWPRRWSRWQLLAAAAAAARAGLGDVLAGYAPDGGAAAGCGEGGALLAAAALEHAQAGLACCKGWAKGRSDAPGEFQQLGRWTAGPGGLSGGQQLINQISNPEVHCNHWIAEGRSDEASGQYLLCCFAP